MSQSSHIKRLTLYFVLYHLVNVISLFVTQRDHIKVIWLNLQCLAIICLYVVIKYNTNINKIVNHQPVKNTIKKIVQDNTFKSLLNCTLPSIIYEVTLNQIWYFQTQKLKMFQKKILLATGHGWQALVPSVKTICGLTSVEQLW